MSASLIESQEWLTPKEAAVIVKRHPQFILKACNGGQLAHSRFGRLGHIRIRHHDLEFWMLNRPVLSADKTHSTVRDQLAGS